MQRIGGLEGGMEEVPVGEGSLLAGLDHGGAGLSNSSMLGGRGGDNGGRGPMLAGLA